MADTVQKMRPLASRVATTATESYGVAKQFAKQTYSQAMESSKTGWNMRAIGVAMFAASLIPVVGMGISYGLEHHRNGKIEANQKDVFANHFRKQIAAQLRMDPSKVNASHLALIDPASELGKAASKIKKDKADANRTAALASGGAAAASWFIPIPGAGTIAHTAMQMGVHVAGGTAGALVSSALSKDVLQSSDVIGMLDEKQSKQAPITAADIVTLRISQNEELQRALKKQNGIAFHKMGDAQQRAVIIGMPDMRDAQEIANAVNERRVDVQDVLMMQPQKPSWSQKIAQERGARATGTFVEQHNTRRAQSQMASNTFA